MAAGPSSSRTEAPSREQAPKQQEFTISGKTLDEYFAKKHHGTKVTRGELAQIMQLFASKGAVADAMQVLEFNLRRSIRAMIAEEQGRVESMSEGGIILPPGQ